MSKQTNHDSTPEASTIANPLRREIAQLLDELRSVSDERLPGVRERLDALVDAVGQTGSAYANGVRTQTERIASVAKDEIVHSRDLTQEYVRANPWRSMAAVGALAMIAGMLFGRRRG